ncbi:MAG: response regulator [Bacteroidota bacterium]
MKILIADESQLVCARYVTMLAEQDEVEIVGYANTVRETLTSIEQLKPAAVILDTRIGGGNGLDMLRSIKRLHAAPVILVFTNDPYPQYRKACLDAGADFLFDKSTEFTRVNDVLHQLRRQTIPKERL